VSTTPSDNDRLGVLRVFAVKGSYREGAKELKGLFNE
jgi:hypothetical protein